MLTRSRIGRLLEVEMRVVVDFDRCDSTGLCAAAAPQVFALGDDDLLRISNERPPPEHWSAAQEAARACPKLAITLVDEG